METASIKIEHPIYKPKSKLVIGNISIMVSKRFNWFNRLMLKLVFGLNIKNIKEDEYEN